MFVTGHGFWALTEAAEAPAADCSTPVHSGDTAAVAEGGSPGKIVILERASKASEVAPERLAPAHIPRY